MGLGVGEKSYGKKMGIGAKLGSINGALRGDNVSGQATCEYDNERIQQQFARVGLELHRLSDLNMKDCSPQK